MHLVFATSIVPDGDAATGYEIANAAIIDALRRAGARVTVLGFTWPGKHPADPDKTMVLGEADVRTDTASPAQKLRWLATALLSDLTFSSAKLRIVPATAVREALCEIGPFDAYVVNAVQFAGAFEELLADKPSIFVAHNVEHRSAEQSAAAASSLVQRLLFRREARLLARLEQKLCARARFVFTLSQEDQVTLGVAGDDKSASLPLVTRTGPPPAPAPRRPSCDAALIGTWTWAPNRIGLGWFLTAVLPHLPPDFTVRVAGHVPAGMFVSHPGVKFVGRVPDASAFVREAAVIPLVSRAGTGVQLKTIETFELGLPSVATTSALRGIGHVPANCTVTDDPADFAAALQAAARARQEDADGRAFYHAQLNALDTQVMRGLHALGFERARVPA